MPSRPTRPGRRLAGLRCLAEATSRSSGVRRLSCRLRLPLCLLVFDPLCRGESILLFRARRQDVCNGGLENRIPPGYQAQHAAPLVRPVAALAQGARRRGRAGGIVLQHADGKPLEKVIKTAPAPYGVKTIPG